MKKKILVLQIIVSTALAGGGGTGLTQTFAECRNLSNEKLTINFNENSGYYILSDKKIDNENFFLDAKTWSTANGAFQIFFDSKNTVANFESKSRPFDSTVMDKVGKLEISSLVYTENLFSCVHY